MQIKLSCGLQKIVKRIPWGENPEYRHQQHLGVSLGWKVRTFYSFLASIMLIYVNLCKLGCPVVLKN